MKGKSMTTLLELSTEYVAQNLGGEASEGNHPPRINLSSLENIRHEMSRVYRSMRSGLINTRDGSRLIYSLTSISKILEAEEASKQLLQLTTIDVKQSSALDGINLSALTSVELNALEAAVNTIDSIKDGKPLPLSMLSKEDYAEVLKQALSEV